jgi:hypothetical protein
MTIRRREFLAGSGASLTASVASDKGFAQAPIPAPTSAPAKIHTRLSTVDPNLSAKTWDSYAKAVQIMLKLPPSDGRNWYRQAMIHQIDCPHGNFWFVNWHRGYIWRFEQIVRELSGDSDFALPFWDWSSLQEVPAQVYNGLLNPTNPAFVDSFNDFWAAYGTATTIYYNSLSASQKAGMNERGITSPQSLQASISGAWSVRAQARGNRALSSRAKAMCSPTTVTQILRLTDFITFGSQPSANHNDEFKGFGALEGQPHNNVHNSVGTPYGFMGDFMSPVDPAFWLHHANVDRLWWRWQKLNPTTRGLPTPQQGLDRWLAEPYQFFFDNVGNPAPAKGADFVSSEALGVTYGPGFGDAVSAQPFVVASAPAQVRRVELGAGLAGTQALALRNRREVSAQQAVTPSILAASRGMENAPALIARIAIMPPADARFTTVDVFINHPGLGPNTSTEDPHYVTTITFFGAAHGVAQGGHAGHGGGKPVEYAVPLNAALDALARAGKPVERTIRVQLRANAPGADGMTLDVRLAGVRVGGEG